NKCNYGNSYRNRHRKETSQDESGDQDGEEDLFEGEEENCPKWFDWVSHSCTCRPCEQNLVSYANSLNNVCEIITDWMTKVLDYHNSTNSTSTKTYHSFSKFFEAAEKDKAVLKLLEEACKQNGGVTIQGLYLLVNYKRERNSKAHTKVGNLNDAKMSIKKAHILQPISRPLEKTFEKIFKSVY
ncbi:8899_t:CDS:2, partial [Funneliformis geosporum]